MERNNKQVKFWNEGRWFYGTVISGTDSTLSILYFDRGWRTAEVHSSKVVRVS